MNGSDGNETIGKAAMVLCAIVLAVIYYAGFREDAALVLFGFFLIVLLVGAVTG